MNILYALNTRCLLQYKFCFSSPVIRSYHSPCHIPLRSFLRTKQLFLTSSRHLSWDNFYFAISSSSPILAVQNILLDFHSISGLPWWTVIMLTTLGIRTIFVFPLAVHQHQVIARLINLKAELAKMVPQMNKEVNIAAKMYGWDELSAKKVFKKNMRRYYNEFILRDNCHPFKIVLLALFQVPIWICFSISLRNLTFNLSSQHYDLQEIQQQFKSEGALWFTDLTTPDTFIIPILLAFVNITLIEIHALRQYGTNSKFQKYLLYLMRFISLSVAGAATLNPCSVSFYWLCSSTFGLIQSIILMSPRFRRNLWIPHTANESSTPFKDIATNFRKRFLS